MIHIHLRLHKNPRRTPKTRQKNDYFQEMQVEVLTWGLEPAFVTGDSGYSSLDHLKMIKHHHQGFLFALESNRLVSIEKGQWSQIQQLPIPEDGLLVCLRGFGTVKVFRQWLKDQPHHYALYSSPLQVVESLKFHH